jgi:DNA-binding NtrC family response regulator
MNTIPLGLCSSLPAAPHPTVLFVDDDPMFLEVVPPILKHKLPHLSVETCASSRLAAQKGSEGHYDVAVIDLTMPELDGLEVLAHIRKRRPCTSVIFITGKKDRDIAEHVFGEGAYDFIGKPFDSQELIWSVDMAVRIHRLRRRVDERKVYLSQVREILDRRWTNAPSITTAAAIDESRSLMRASLESMEVAAKQTEAVIQRAERMLRRREEQTHRMARQRLQAV